MTLLTVEEAAALARLAEELGATALEVDVRPTGALRFRLEWRESVKAGHDWKARPLPQAPTGKRRPRDPAVPTVPKVPRVV